MNLSALRDLSEELRAGRVNDIICRMEKHLNQGLNLKIWAEATIYVAFSLAHLQSYRASLQKCRDAIETVPNWAVSYYLYGVIKLWLNNEKEAVEIWCQGLPHITNFKDSFIINCLIANHNLRSYILKHKHDIPNIIDLYANFVVDNWATDCDLDTAYAELRNNSLVTALTYFTIIIDKSPSKLEAYRGRGITYCLLGRWTKCIEDLDREFPKELETDALRFVAIAMASVGNVYGAISKLSQAIANSPTDFEAIAERGKLQMARGLYSLALQDFRSVPEQCYTDRIWLYIAESLYSLGDILRANEAIERCQLESDHRKHYCQYLILRAKGFYFKEEAKKHIMQAAQLLPSFFLVRACGDFMMDIGDMNLALQYYEAAISQKPDDVETLRSYAIALFHTGKIDESYKLLNQLCNAFLASAYVDTCEKVINGHNFAGKLLNFNESIHFPTVKNNILSDFMYVHKYIKCFNEQISNLTRETNDSNFEKMTIDCINEEIKIENLTEIELDPLLRRLVEDADRIGRRCIPHVMECVENMRLTRGLGFCVLFAGYCIQKMFSQTKVFEYSEILNGCINILSFVDLRRPVMHRSPKCDFSMKFTPSFELQRNEKKSSRFYGAVKPALEKLRQYITLQHPFENINHSNYDFGVDNYSLPRVFAQQEFSTINWKNLGVKGGLLTVNLNSTYEVMTTFDRHISGIWGGMFENDEPSGIKSLSLLMQIIWSRFPLTNYSIEFAHCILHAFVIGKYGAELEKLESDHSVEYFIRHLIDPSIPGFDSAITEHLENKKLMKQYSENSLDFWKRLPSAKMLSQLYNVPSVIGPPKMTDDLSNPATVKK